MPYFHSLLERNHLEGLFSLIRLLLETAVQKLNGNKTNFIKLHYLMNDIGASLFIIVL